MANFSRKSRIKIRNALVVLAAVVCAAAFGAVPIALARLKPLIIRESSRHFAQPLKIGGIRYMPPGSIVLRDISLAQTSSAGADAQLLDIPEIRISLSLRDSFRKRRFVIGDVTVVRAKLYEPQVYVFARDYGKKIVDLILSLPQQDIKLNLRDVTLNASGYGREGRRFFLDAAAGLKNGIIEAHGLLGQERQAVCPSASPSDSCISRSIPFEYRLTGILGKRGFTVQSLEFSRENVFIKAWGAFSESALSAHGFAFINTAFKEREYFSPRPPLPGSIPRLFAAKSAPLPKLAMSDANLFILDLDCLMSIRIPDIVIDRLKFSLNNNPLSTRGTLRTGRQVAYDLTVVSDRGNNPDKRLEHIRKLSLAMKGEMDVPGSFLRGSGKLELSYGKAGDAAYPYEHTGVAFKGLNISWRHFPRLGAQMDAADIVCVTGSNNYSLSIRDTAAAAQPGGKGDFLLGARGLMYDGSFRVRSRIEGLRFPLNISSVMRMRGVSADKLQGLLIHFAKVKGKISGQMSFKSRPAAVLKGGMSIKDGYLRDFEFFKWLADFFSLPSLGAFPFSRALVYFSVDDAGARLRNISLRADDVSVSGFYNLGKKDFVSSKLSLALSRRLLEESEKFKPMIRMLGPGEEPVVFDFRLSGLLHAMNFQWMDSELKTEVRKSIPGFVERQIEKNIEHQISAGAAK